MQAAALLGLTDVEQGSYLNHFHAVPAAAPIVPAFVRKPTAPGATSALVVGQGQEPLTTDREQTEAKARESIAAAYGLGKFLVGKGKVPKVTGLCPDHELLHFLLSDSSDKRSTVQPLVQMSREWIRSRAGNEGLDPAALSAVRNARASRRVVLVTFESTGALDRAKALADIHAMKPDNLVHPHVEHGITREWEGAEVDAVARARGETYRLKQATTGNAATDVPSKSSKRPKAPR